MAKKPTTPKSEAPAAPETAPVIAAKAAPKKPSKAKTETAAAPKAAKKPKVAAKKPAKAPAAPRTRVKATAVTKPGPATASITPADIALRAYFICETRQKLGLPGDSTSDWVQAERQLKAEAAAASK